MVEMTGHVARMGEKRIHTQLSVRKTERKRLFDRHGNILKNIIKTDFKEFN
jgi:hypothetical protein